MTEAWLRSIFFVKTLAFLESVLLCSKNQRYVFDKTRAAENLVGKAPKSVDSVWNPGSFCEMEFSFC